jgi:glycosyltransferase involved in cell wall biosynthesis
MAFDAELGGGSLRIAYALATLLARHGHHLTVVCEDLYGRGVEREIVNGITVLRYRLPKSDGLSFRRHEKHIRAVKNLVTKYLAEPPEVVHGHHILQYVGVLDMFQNQSRCCYTIHSPAIDELRITWGAQRFKGKLKTLLGLPIIRKIERSILYHSSGLTALSNYTISLISGHYGDVLARKIQMIPGWADLERFQPLPQNQVETVKRQLGWPTDVPVFFILRRLEPRMGLDNLLNAILLIKKHGYGLHVAIGGSGSLRTHLEKLRDALDLENDVTFMGFVSANILPLAYGACDASVIPTAQLECFGIIALEALACGCTTLVTPVGALPEVMHNFEPKWIARDATSEGIADLLLAFLQRRLPSHQPKELHDLVKQKYSAEKAVDAYERLLFP